MEIVGFHTDGEEEVSAKVVLKSGKIHVHYGRSEGAIVAGLSTDDVILRNMTLPVKSKRGAKQALPFQLESALPSSPEDFVVLPQYEKTKKGIDLSIFAVQKNRLQEFLRGLPINPEVVSCVPIALSRFYNDQFPEKSFGIICHLGRNRTDIVVTRNKKVLAALPLHKGANSLESLEAELDRGFYFIEQKFGKIAEVVLTGLFPTIPNAEQLIKKSCHASIILVEEKLAYHAIPIGLCIDALSKEGIQFRQSIFVHQGYQKKVWGVTLQSISAIFLLTALGYGVTKHFFSKREADLKNRVEKFIQAHEKEMPNLRNHVQYEKEGKVHEVLAVLNRLHKSFIRSQKNYRFYERPSQVSTVLSWLSGIPQLAEGALNVSKFHYELEKYPKLGSPHTPYAIKVVLEVKGESEKAEEFHQLLESEKEMIVKEKKIEWSEQEDGYTATFYLKNRS